MYEMFHAGCGEQSKQLMLCEHGADIQYRICTAMGQTYSIEYAQPQLVHVPQLYTCILDLTARPASRRSTTEANMLLPPPLPTGTYVRTHIIL